MRKLLKICCAALLLAAAGAHAQSPDPDAARIVTADIPCFWQAFDKASPDFAAEPFQKLYLDRGTPGLQDFVQVRIGSAKDLARAVRTLPRYYQGKMHHWTEVRQRSAQTSLPFPDRRVPCASRRIPSADRRVPGATSICPGASRRFKMPRGTLNMPWGRLIVPQGRLKMPQGRLRLPQGQVEDAPGQIEDALGHIEHALGQIDRAPGTGLTWVRGGSRARGLSSRFVRSSKDYDAFLAKSGYAARAEE